MLFPKSFDSDFYKKNNTDLKFMNNDELNEHYNTFGIYEGRFCSEGQTRQYYYTLNKKFNDLLEIGPFDNPILRGDNVKYFDVLNKDELLERAKNIGRINQLNNIPFIHYVDKNAQLNIINKKFDIVLSCHSIEHSLNIVKHLNDVEKILKDNGYYIVICPDKRYCFDNTIKESTIADILDSHYREKKMHDLKSIIEHRALTTHNNPEIHWKNKNVNLEQDINVDLISSAILEYKNSINNNTYVDVHSFQFTPRSFSNIINILNKLNLIKLKIHRVYNTPLNSNEFIIILSF